MWQWTFHFYEPQFLIFNRQGWTTWFLRVFLVLKFDTLCSCMCTCSVPLPNIRFLYAQGWPYKAPEPLARQKLVFLLIFFLPHYGFQFGVFLFIWNWILTLSTWSILSLPSALLRHNRHITLYKFKVYNMVLWYTYIFWNVYHSSVS